MKPPAEPCGCARCRSILAEDLDKLAALSAAKGEPESFAAAVDEFREAGRDLVHHIGKRVVPVVEPIVHMLARALGWFR